MGKLRDRAARRAQNLADRLAGNTWREDPAEGTWYRRRPRRFASIDTLQGLCLKLQDELGEGGGVQVFCGGDVAAEGPLFTDLEKHLARYSPEARRWLAIREREQLWTVSFGSTWSEGAIPLSVKVAGSSPESSMRASNARFHVERGTLPYGWLQRLRQAPLVEPYMLRDLRQHSLARRATFWGVVAGVLSGVLSGVTAGGGWPWS